MAKIPSIALIPSGYKATKVYSVLPTDGSADLTFNRGTSDDQTRVNSNGLIEDVDQDVPRLDYSDGSCPSLLLEPASENLITYSEEFDNAAWSKSGAATSVTENSIISPKGDLTADLATIIAAGARFLFQNETLTNTNKYTLSCFFKKSTNDWVALGAYDAITTDFATCSFDINNGLVGSTSASSGSVNTVGSIEDYGNGWYRCSITFTATSSNSWGIRIYSAIASETSYASALNDANYLWGAMLEQQSYATSYVPSLGTSGVRQAETASKTGLSSYINSTEGVLYFEGRALADDGTNRFISLSDGTNDNRVLFGYRAASKQLLVRIEGNNSASVDLTTTLLDVQTNIKIAISYDGSYNYKLLVNGILIDSAVGTDNIIGLDRLSFTNATSTENFYGKTKDLRVYKEALSDLELATLTGFTSFAEMRSYLNYSAE